MTSPRRRRRDLTRLAESLSDRDWQVLDDLGRVRLLTGRQVQRLHVHEGSAITQARRTRSLMQRLFELSLVTRLDRRVGGMRMGSSGFTYALSTAGQRLVTGRGPAGGVRLRRYWEPSASFVDHLLGVSELYVGLREVELVETSLELIEFDAEPGAWRSWIGLSGERLSLKPDGFSVVGDDTGEQLSFIELDRSTESLRVIRRKAEVYIAYWHSGSEQRRNQVFPTVVFVVPDERRRAAVAETLSHLDAEAWQLSQVVRAAQALSALCGRPPPMAPGAARTRRAS